MDRKGQKQVRKVLAEGGFEADPKRRKHQPIEPEIPPKDKRDVAWLTIWVKGHLVREALNELSSSNIMENLDNTNGSRDRLQPCLRVIGHIDIAAAETKGEFPIFVHDVNASPVGNSSEIG